MVARLIRWSSRRMRSTRVSAVMCPSWRRNTLTMESRLLERLLPAGRRLSRKVAVESIAGVVRRLNGEGRAAAAGRLRVRVLDRESAARHVVDEVHFGAGQVTSA